MFRRFLSVVRPQHVLVAVPVALFLLATLSFSRPESAFASGSCDPLRPHATGNFPDETITTLDGLTASNPAANATLNFVLPRRASQR